MTTAVIASSAEVEMTILGCMMNSASDLQAAHEIIEVDDFADSHHRKIFKAIKEAKRSKEVVDLLILREILKNNDELQEIGGYV